MRDAKGIERENDRYFLPWFTLNHQDKKMLNLRGPTLRMSHLRKI